MISAKKAKFEGTIQPWGNSLGLRITRPMGDLAHLSKGSKVEIEITEQGLLVKPAVKKPARLKLPYSEAELVRGLTPVKAHADELPAPLASEAGE
ncbi:MAG: transcriptional regulator [Gammaproteobacteria bacterium]|jgi:antitoxin MazE|nr:transcriptional regulator [Gammaproteobacteria bacterium]